MIDTASFWVQIAVMASCSYLMGSIPFGYLVGRIRGVDLRTVGSKNIGATNAGRVLGKKYFILVFLLDAAKGFFPTLLNGIILFHYSLPQQWLNLIWLVICFFIVAGHNWPIWLGFKGGKGVSTSLGIVLAIYPYYTFPGLIAFAVWIILVKISRYVSLGSVVGAATFLVSYILLLTLKPNWSFHDQWPLLFFAIFMVSILIFRHSANINRLRNGTESKF
jgi:glycerol-3-phosphate acyltransferase PlsY